ncbi:MAG: class I SAM-dependent methyltransferase [Myxococcota bacterium]
MNEPNHRIMSVVKQAVELGPVQETLLIPLVSRAEETKKANGLVNDPRAVEIVESLDYDFDKWTKYPTLLAGACVRTRMFDIVAERFLAMYPTGTVIEIGCGLNTRFERIDNGEARWFDLDLPDSIALRRHYFEDVERRTMLVGSVVDEEWLEPVADTGGPYLFLSEAVLVYLKEAEVRKAITQIAARCPHAWLVTDLAASKLTTPEYAAKSRKRIGISAWFNWGCDDPSAIESWLPGIKLLSADSFGDAPDSIVERMPTMYRILTRYARWLVRLMTKHYLIAHYRLGGAADTTGPNSRSKPNRPRLDSPQQ